VSEQRGQDFRHARRRFVHEGESFFRGDPIWPPSHETMDTAEIEYLEALEKWGKEIDEHGIKTTSKISIWAVRLAMTAKVIEDAYAQGVKS